MSVLVRNYTDDEAVIIMVDSNIQRENILPSEKAHAYKMKYDAMKHQGSKGEKYTADMVGETAGDSGRTVQRYIRLASLSDGLLEYEKKWFLMEHEEYGTRAAYVILSEEGAVVMNDCYNGFDEEARRNIHNFMQQQAEQAQEQQKQQEMQAQSQIGQSQSEETQKKKPELANWQKVMDNGEYLRSAEMTEEANYNMIDGLMNNTLKKQDKNAPRRSVLKRLRNHQKKIASQGKGQPQQQKAMEEEMERKKK